MSDLIAFKNLIKTLVPSALDDLITIFSYQGFSPEMVMKHFLEIKTSKDITDNDFKKDLTALICLGVISGNYTSKNKEKRAEEGTKQADELFTRYNLHMGSLGTNKRAVTLPRVLLTFPTLTSDIALMCPEKNFSGPFGTSSLPHIMKTAVFPSLIPSNVDKPLKDYLLMLYCCYTCDQTRAINNSMKNAPDSEIYKKQYDYVEISHKSIEPSEGTRVDYYKKIVQPALKSGKEGMKAVASKYIELVDPKYTIPEKQTTS